MGRIKKLISEHPNLWQFILFNLLSNCATITNFVVMWIGTGVIFRSLRDTPFHFWIFDYSAPESLELCGFLSFLVATAAAQTVNFFVQKYLVFHSEEKFSKAVWKYCILAVVLVVVSTALPAYSQAWMLRAGIPTGLVPTLANVLNIVVQVLLSYPTMKFWIMP